jgi:hypothetical protein
MPRAHTVSPLHDYCTHTARGSIDLRTLEFSAYNPARSLACATSERAGVPSEIFLVDGASVSFSFEESGPRWACSQCGCDCCHILIAAARMTLKSWEVEEGEVEC